MKTPIYDFLVRYSESDASRLHMPGHKGVSVLGCEKFDITEFDGADDLFAPSGIIQQSETNATEIFESGATFYSCEGSSLSIKTMLYAAFMARDKGKNKIAAVRNVHKSFITACVLLGIDIVWIYPKNASGLCSGVVTSQEVFDCLGKNKDIFALYLTSPTYLGEITDINSVSKICKKYNIPLLVDNAHGAYLKFCKMHPIDLGADICCDSAHKTLPVLTGGAYLHISEQAKEKYQRYIKKGMALFASTSPSYLILTSLDLCNKYLTDNYKTRLYECIKKVDDIKNKLISYGFKIIGNEPLKLSIVCNGLKLNETFKKAGIYCEYYDKTVLTLMFTPENKDIDYIKVLKAIENTPSYCNVPEIIPGQKKLTVRQAYLSDFETVSVDSALSKICAVSSVSCPPAIPIAIAGETITEHTIEALKFYGINEIDVIK